MQLQTTTFDRYTVVTVTGDVDYGTAPLLKDALLEAVGDGDVHVVVDLLGVEFIESTGLGVLLGARRRVAEREGSVAVVCADNQVLRTVEITGLARALAIHYSLDSAVASIVGSTPGPR